MTRSIRHNRNILIYYAAVTGRKRLCDLARQYRLTPARVKQIVLNEAKKRAPKLFYELSAMRYYYCGGSTQGPAIFELVKFQDQFLWGDV